MPRKQNGWGTSSSFSFGRLKSVSVAKGFGAAGDYPSSRRYGARVSRSVIEKYDMDSDWAKWRKGYEYYLKAAYNELVVENEYYGVGSRLNPIHPLDKAPGEEYRRAELDSVLYQGTSYELPTHFYGWEFASKNGDGNAHYVVKRTPEKGEYLGVVKKVFNDPNRYIDQKNSREIWVKGDASQLSRLLLNMEGERITDQETEATLKCVLTEDGLPATYIGKTFPVDMEGPERELQSTRVNMRIPLANIAVGNQEEKEYIASQGLRSVMPSISAKEVMQDTRNLIGKIIYLPEFYIEKTFDGLKKFAWADAEEYFGLIVQDITKKAKVYCLDSEVETLPPSMYDIASLPNLFDANDVTVEIIGTYIFQKKEYNKYYPNKLVTASDVEKIANDLSYGILPFTIEGAYIDKEDLVIESVPFSSEVRVHPKLNNEAIVVFTDYSFCKYSEVDDAVHMYTDVQPWQDEVFTNGKPLEAAVTFTCSCPDHSHSIVAAPQATDNYDSRKRNRQQRYPLPSVMGLDSWQGLGVDQYAGKLTTWETTEHKYGLRLCKHAIAARFAEGIKVIEPSQYPSYESRIKFEEKLREEVNELQENFRLSYRRSKISLSEIVFSLAQGLNLNGVETAYVLFNTN